MLLITLLYQGRIWLKKWFSTLSMHQNLPHALLNTNCSVPLRDFDHKVWLGPQKCTFLTSFQVLLVMLIKGPHFEKHTADGRNEAD